MTGVERCCIAYVIAMVDAARACVSCRKLTTLHDSRSAIIVAVGTNCPGTVDVNGCTQTIIEKSSTGASHPQELRR